MEKNKASYNLYTMYSKNILLGLALLIVAMNAQSLAFDLRGIKYAPGPDFWEVEVPVSGGSGKYAYEFDLPPGWKYENNRIKIPSSSVQNTRNQYSVRSRVKDTVKGDVLERSLLFKPFQQGSSYSLEVSDRDYFYGSVNGGSGASSNSGTIIESGTTIHGIEVLNRLNALVKNIEPIPFNSGSAEPVPLPTVSTSSNVRGSVRGPSVGSGQSYGSYGPAGLYSGSYSGSGSYAYAGASGVGSGVSGVGISGVGASGVSGVGVSGVGVSGVRTPGISGVGVSGISGVAGDSYASVYTVFPSSAEVDKMINAGAIVEIIKTIQLVVDSKVRCEAKSAYLSDFLGRIYAAIEVKKFTLNELKAIVTEATTQIQRLTAQITTIKSKQAALNLADLKKQYDQIVVQYKASYEEYTKSSTSSISYDTEITSLEKNITNINVKYSEVQKNLQSWKKSVQNIDSDIADYELKIKALKEKKLSYTQDIAKAEAFIQDSDVQIKAIRQKITSIKTKITTSATTIESLKKAYLDIEIKMNSAKATYESANAQNIKWDKEISSINVEIERYQKQTSELEGKQVTQQIENLQSAITEIRASIDFIKYKCYNAGNIQLATDLNGRGSYQFGQNQWFNYVGTSYDLTEQLRYRIAQSFNKQVVEISTVNVFSDLWRQNYGSVFEKDIALKSQNWKTDTSFKFDSDFSCSADFGNTFSRSGVIQDIRGNSVSVKGDDGKDYNLRLGSCSTFEGPGKNFLPAKGQNILWRGAPSGNGFNMHTSTCY